MVLPPAIMVAVAAIVVAGSSPAELLRVGDARVVRQGPVLAGDALVWAEESKGARSLHFWTAGRGDRVVYRRDSLSVTRPLAASRTFVAFERSFPTCPPPTGHVCPDGADSLIGPLAGPFRTLARARTCFLPTIGRSLGVDGGVAAYLELDCTRQRLRVVVRDVARGTRPQVLREAPVSTGCCRNISLAGRYVAWPERRDIVVYSWLARRVAYRARIGVVGGNVDFDFDLQRDGKLAIAFRRLDPPRASTTTLVWRSASSPLLNVMPFRGRDTRVSIAGDHIAFERFVSRSKSSLVVADLGRHARTIARLGGPARLRSFDFDGRRISWASDRLTSRRVDCPPPGQGRPCVRRESGLTSIWVQPISATTRRLIARMRFSDAFAR